METRGRGPLLGLVSDGEGDPLAADREEHERRVLEGAGHAAPALRRAAARRDALPDDLASLVEKVHRHAYKVTDEDIAALRQSYSDDELFEVIVSAAVGASLERRGAGLKALREAE